MAHVTGSTDPFAGSSPNGKIAPFQLLVVEDHENSLEALSRMLTQDGHSVVTARNVASALAAAATREFELVISDIGLPDGSGIELMEQLRASYGLRGIALSGYGTEADRNRSREAGFVAHLVKPASIADIRHILAFFASRQEADAT